MFTDIAAGLPGVGNSSAAWGDYDGDGDLDLVLTGFTGSENISRVYRNDGGVFTDIAAGLFGTAFGSCAWCDYDNDGDLDIAVNGEYPDVTSILTVYRNDEGVFMPLDGLWGGLNGTTAWGDYDNDGDLDILVTGRCGDYVGTYVYRNDAGTWSEGLGWGLTPLMRGCGSWGDYDNDGDLDILLTGESDLPEPVARLYSNNATMPNTPPTAPANLAVEIEGGLATFTWNAATDGQTPSDGLTYNLRVGTTSGGCQVVSPMASASTGYRRVVQLGNAGCGSTSLTVALPAGTQTIFWSVQAIDAAFAGSPFATQQQAVPTAFTDIEAGLSGLSDCDGAWGDYDADGDLDLVAVGQGSFIYRNDGGVFQDIDADLPVATFGAVSWGDYDNDADIDLLIIGNTYSGPSSGVYRNDDGVFADAGAGLPGVWFGAAAWGDYDGDGDLDIVLTGYTATGRLGRIYRNDAGVFTDISAGLPEVSESSVAWGDYDNDGDLDLLLMGYTGSEMVTRVYRNDAGAFTDIAAALEQTAWGSCAWGDCDGDGDLDIAVNGVVMGEFTWVIVYSNDGGVFTQGADPMPGGAEGGAAWGDYDNDGDLDLLVTGGDVSYICRNGGIGNWYGDPSDPHWDFVPLSRGRGSWGDYDNDGDLDILLTGQDGSGIPVTLVYRNKATTANTPPTAPTNLEAEVGRGSVTFSWDAAMDGQTPSLGLTYNLRIGTTPGGSEVMSAMADLATGYRRVAQLGNTNHNTSWAIELPGMSHCYWSVQAVDNAFAGSAFASGDVLTGVVEPEVPSEYVLHPNVPNPFNPITTHPVRPAGVVRGDAQGVRRGRSAGAGAPRR